MDKWENLAEKKIREAMEEGEFANLDGAGQPLNLEENPYEPPELGLVRRLLRNNGFALPWIEERKELQSQLDGLRTELARHLARDSKASSRLDSREILLERLKELLGVRIGELNRRIAQFNLKAPSPKFHLLRLDLSREVEKFLSSR